MKHFIYILAAMTAALTLPMRAQQTISGKDWKATQCVAYTYTCDASLPREEKQNYCINVLSDHVELLMWNDYKEHKELFFGFSPKEFENFKKQLARMKPKALPEAEGTQVRGAAKETLECSKEQSSTSPYFKAYTSKGAGTLSLQSGNLSEPFLALLPEPVDALLVQNLPKHTPRLRVTDEQWTATDLVRYSFTDSSTPPQYHRSYDISICKDSIVVNVTSYGDLLLTQTYPFTAEKFDALKKQLASQGFSKGEKTDGPMPTGGTEHSVAFYSRGKCFFSAYSYAGIGTLYIEKGNAASAFIKALPEDINAIVNSTRKDNRDL